jgi:hypothetical protein
MTNPVISDFGSLGGTPGSKPALWAGHDGPAAPRRPLAWSLFSVVPFTARQPLRGAREIEPYGGAFARFEGPDG